MYTLTLLSVSLKKSVFIPHPAAGDAVMNQKAARKAQGDLQQLLTVLSKFETKNKKRYSDVTAHQGASSRLGVFRKKTLI